MKSISPCKLNKASINPSIEDHEDQKDLNMKSMFSFTPGDSYEGFPAYPKELYRHDILEIIDAKKFRYQFRLNRTYEVPEKDIEKLLLGFGEIWGSREYFVVSDEYVLTPITIASTKETSTFALSGCTTFENHIALEERLKIAFAPYIKDKPIINVEWAIPSRQGISYADIQSTFDETIYPEAYPYIPNIQEYIRNFLLGKENVLVLIGVPGTGKTRFIKYIVQTISEIRKDSPSILYSMDEKIFADDSFFFHFLSCPFDALVLEDIDFNLKSRKTGNSFMYKLLGASDGFITNPTKKIILSTNLPSINDIDEALLRKGRCYDVLKMQRLTVDQAQILMKKIKPEYVIPLIKKEYTLAELYAL